MDSAISKIQACKTADELFAVTNTLLTEVEGISSAARVMLGPKPIRSASDLRVWLRELKAAANKESPKEARDIFAQLFSWLRAAGRKLDAIGYRD